MAHQNEFSRAVELQEKGQLVEAEHLFQKLVTLQPDSPEIIHRWAAVLYELKRFEESVSALKRVCALCPNDAKARFNLAMTLKISGQAEESLLELGNAYELNRADLNVANQYACLLFEQQRYEQAIPVCEQVQSLAGFSAEATANLGNALYKAGNLSQAVECFSRAVSVKPDYAYAKQMIARCYIDRNQSNDAIALLQELAEASSLAPDGYLLLSSALVSQDRLPEAIKACRSSLELQPESDEAWHRLGDLYQRHGALSDAETAYRNAIVRSSESVDSHVSLAFLLERMTRLEDARNTIDAAQLINPLDPSLFLVGAVVCRREGKYEAAVDIINKLLALDTGIERVHRAMELSADYSEERYIAPQAYFELGQALDRLGRYDEAYTAFEKANQLKSETRKAKQFDRCAYLNEVKQLDGLVTPELAGIGSERTDQEPTLSPVFLVGFPRSGTTLLGNILDSHPEIQVADEAPLLDPVQKYLASRPGGYPFALSALGDADLETMRSLYFEAVSEKIELQPGALLVDKLPLNLAKVALTKRLFPNARYIFLLRHPCDACLSCFMQNFSPNEAMNNFYSLGDSVSLYDLVMRNWVSHCEQLSLPVFQIRYEDIVENFNIEIGRLLSFLDLPWNDAVTEFDRYAREKESIDTPSYHQVTQPIYRHAQYRWRRYGEAFETFLPVLEPWVRRFGYEDS